jgi:ubiquinone/menaquinone biosynthesis C-methylase UbiE
MEDPKQPQDRPKNYIHGHTASVLKSHSQRTASNSCAYLLPYLKPTDHVLDVGCGPGSITLDLARHVPSGHITGIDIASAQSTLSEAQRLAAEAGQTNATFQVGDVGNLAEFRDDTFDVVHAHQVIQHVPDPVAALREMRRVCKPGGLVATRDTCDFIWSPGPSSDALSRFWELFYAVSKWTGGTPSAGRQLKALARKAGFLVDGDGEGDGGKGEVVMQNASTWCYGTKEEIATWAGLWADRVQESGFRKNAVESGLATAEELEELRKGWLGFKEEQDAWFTLVHGEILMRKGKTGA